MKLTYPVGVYDDATGALAAADTTWQQCAMKVGQVKEFMPKVIAITTTLGQGGQLCTAQISLCCGESGC